MSKITFFQCGPKTGQCFDEWAAIGLVETWEDQREEIEAVDMLDVTAASATRSVMLN